MLFCCLFRSKPLTAHEPVSSGIWTFPCLSQFGWLKRRCSDFYPWPVMIETSAAEPRWSALVRACVHQEAVEDTPADVVLIFYLQCLMFSVHRCCCCCCQTSSWKTQSHILMFPCNGLDSSRLNNAVLGLGCNNAAAARHPPYDWLNWCYKVTCWQPFWFKFCVFLSDLLMLHKLFISAGLHFKSLCLTPWLRL